MTSTSIDPQRVIEHVAAHGLGSVWSWLVAIGAAIVVLLVIPQKRRARRRARTGLRATSQILSGRCADQPGRLSFDQDSGVSMLTEGRWS